MLIPLATAVLLQVAASAANLNTTFKAGDVCWSVPGGALDSEEGTSNATYHLANGQHAAQLASTGGVPFDGYCPDGIRVHVTQSEASPDE